MLTNSNWGILFREAVLVRGQKCACAWTGLPDLQDPRQVLIARPTGQYNSIRYHYFLICAATQRFEFNILIGSPRFWECCRNLQPSSNQASLYGRFMRSSPFFHLRFYESRCSDLVGFPVVNDQKSIDFGQNPTQVMGSGYLAMTHSIGHRVDTLDTPSQGST